MPKFIVTSGSYFQPFTYDELAKPIMQTVEAHNAAQDSYDTLVAETEALRQYIMREPNDSEARRMYDSYTEKLTNLQNNLWERGYNAGTRRDLALARAGYASDITRLGTAIKARQDLSNEYWKTKHEHPDMVMAEDPGTAALDKFLANDRFGRDYYSYSGTAFAGEVAADAKARMDEMLNNPEILDKYPQLKGYIPILKKEGFTSGQVEAATLAVRAAYNGDTRLLDKLDPASSILASVLSSNLNSTGAFGKVDKSEFDRLIDYGKKGLSSAIGKSDVQFLQDLDWAQQQKLALEDRRYQHNLDVARVKAAGKGGSGNGNSVYAPNIIRHRGNSLRGPSDKNAYNEFNDKSKVYEALSTLNELKKTSGFYNEDGSFVDAVDQALDVLVDSKYFGELSGGKDNYITKTDLDPVLAQLKSDIDKSVKDEHIYQFNVLPSATSNIARTVFKPNIGELSGKRNAKVAESVAKYSDGSAVKASELKSLLESDNLLVGFDARTGKIVVQRDASDNSQDVGKYNDRMVYLDPKTVLYGTTAYVNAAQLQHMFDSALPDGVPQEEQDKIDNLIASMTTYGDTIDLRYFADVLTQNYGPMVKNGNDIDRAVYNALVRSFALGLFDSANTPWSPNPYKEGWSAKSGGDNMDTSGYDYDDEDEYYIE